VACEAHAQAADELGPGAGWQGYSLRAKGNQNIEIAASDQQLWSRREINS
jgi:hypothetical protein